MSRRTCVVIPAYNAARTIGGLIGQLTGLGLEAVVVDDGSTDQTAGICVQAGARVISHVRNRGKGAALRTGFAVALQAGYDSVITMDSDGQHDPAEIPRLLEAADRSPSVIVIGQRRLSDPRMPIERRWTNRVMSAMISGAARQRIPDSQCGFRVIPCQFLASSDLSGRRYDFETELLLEAGRKGWSIASVPIRTIYDGHRSHIRPLVDGWRFLWLMLRYLVSLPAPEAKAPLIPSDGQF
ncbi:MAG: glycosyltransferase family 2 protein [Candidatus Omnitrophica bacterium]|nr:glycosyltransferase family 2 protein [Candidatus Omnitrophota bacterium]